MVKTTTTLNGDKPYYELECVFAWTLMP